MDEDGNLICFICEKETSELWFGVCPKCLKEVKMKLIKDEYYWVKINDMYGLETAQWNGNSWQCIGRDWHLHKNQVKPIIHIKKPDNL